MFNAHSTHSQPGITLHLSKRGAQYRACATGRERRGETEGEQVTRQEKKKRQTEQLRSSNFSKCTVLLGTALAVRLSFFPGSPSHIAGILETGRN